MPPHVVFVHGLFMTGAESVLLRRHLARELGARTHTFLYMATAEDPDLVADRLGRRVRALGVGTGAGTDAAASAADGTVHLVGHSLGGLVVRWYVQELGGHERVAQTLSLGAPFGGTERARPFPFLVGRELSRTSPLLARLRARAHEHDVPHTSIVGEGDMKHLAMQPSRLSEFVNLVRDRFEDAARLGEMPVFVTSTQARPFVRSIIERFRRETAVLGQGEIHARVRLKTVGSV